VGATGVAVLTLSLLAIFSQRAFIAAMTTVAVVILVLSAWGVASGLYDKVKGRAAEGAISETAKEPISEAERTRLLEQVTEISKLSFEYFKHFMTIATAAALVELALYQQLGLNESAALLGVSLLGLTLVLCIIGLVRLSVGAATKGEFSPVGRQLKRLMVSTALFFLSGIVIFALAALSPTINATINAISHFLYELAQAMAQSIR